MIPAQRAPAWVYPESIVRIIDAHVHFWRIGGPGQSWPDADWPLLYRDFGPADLAAASPQDLTGVVLVQSQPDDRDTDWLLELAAGSPLVLGVVGWVDLASRAAPARIAELARQPKLRGLRPMLQSIEDTHWLLRPELEPALQAMGQHAVRFDALIQPRHLPVLLEFARRWPQLPVVIDHGAKPRISAGRMEPWQAQISALGLCPQVYCKLSGLRTEQASGSPREELEPYMRHLVVAFGERLMWGSDWPVLLHSGDRYSDWLSTARQLAAKVTDPVTPQSLFYEAARRFYGLPRCQAT
jgi:L-fuconolactonase